MIELPAYRCEICGFTSTNRSEVERCERGSRPRPRVGDGIEFYPTYDSEVPMVGWVLEAGQPMERTHYVTYRVRGRFRIPGDEPRTMWVRENLITVVFSPKPAPQVA